MGVNSLPLADSVAAAIRTQTLLRLSPARWPLGYPVGKRWRGPNTLGPDVLHSWRGRVPRVPLWAAGGCAYALDQGWANYSPRAACGPPEYIMRPVGTYMFARFLKFYSKYLNHNQLTSSTLQEHYPKLWTVTFVSLILIELCGQIVCKFSWQNTRLLSLIHIFVRWKL